MHVADGGGPPPQSPRPTAAGTAPAPVAASVAPAAPATIFATVQADTAAAVVTAFRAFVRAIFIAAIKDFGSLVFGAPGTVCTVVRDSRSAVIAVVCSSTAATAAVFVATGTVCAVAHDSCSAVIAALRDASAALCQVVCSTNSVVGRVGCVFDATIGAGVCAVASALIALACVVFCTAKAAFDTVVYAPTHGAMGTAAVLAAILAVVGAGVSAGTKAEGFLVFVDTGTVCAVARYS